MIALTAARMEHLDDGAPVPVHIDAQSDVINVVVDPKRHFSTTADIEEVPPYVTGVLKSNVSKFGPQPGFGDWYDEGGSAFVDHLTGPEQLAVFYATTDAVADYRGQLEKSRSRRRQQWQ
jgi:hypothetical protein